MLLFWLNYNLKIIEANVPQALILCQALYMRYPNSPYDKPRDGTVIILIFK